MKILWIGGWGCSAASTRQVAQQVCPAAEHEIVLPVPGCIEQIDTSSADAVVAYSTGAFLLSGAPQVFLTAKRVVLVSPFCDFRAESGRGGKTPTAKLRFLIKWLRRDPLAALQDFYQRAGLGEPPTELPYAQEDLVWGIEQLATVAQPVQTDCGAAMGHLTALVGGGDPLLDAELLREDFPALQIVEGAGHALTDFRKELADALR